MGTQKGNVAMRETAGLADLERVRELFREYPDRFVRTGAGAAGRGIGR